DGIRAFHVTGVQTCALPILLARARQRPNIELLEQLVAVDLITERRLGMDGQRNLGAYVLNRASGEVETFHSRFSVLACGGAAKRSEERRVGQEWSARSGLNA